MQSRLGTSCGSSLRSHFACLSVLAILDQIFRLFLEDVAQPVQTLETVVVSFPECRISRFSGLPCSDRKGTGQPHIKLVNTAHFVVRWDTFEVGRMGNLRAATMRVTTHSVVGLGSLPNQLNDILLIVT